MTTPKNITAKTSPFIVANDHQRSNYFEAIKVLVAEREKAQASERPQWQQAIDEIYALVADEIRTNSGEPSQAISFGTSGWRGILGKDLFLRSVAVVTAAILTLYKEADADASLHASLGVDSFAEMQERGCVLGFDNRFGGPMLALAVANVLAAFWDGYKPRRRRCRSWA